LGRYQDDAAAVSTPVLSNGSEGSEGLGPNEPRHSPLAAYTHLLFGTELDEAAQRRQFEAMQVRRENLISQCMTELGFDYIPHLESVELKFTNSEEWRPDDPNRVAQWGYGIVSSPIPLVIEGPAFVMGGVDFGPNNEMLRELIDSERPAWEDALWGESLGELPSVPALIAA